MIKNKETVHKRIKTNYLFFFFKKSRLLKAVIENKYLHSIMYKIISTIINLSFTY